jgi:simple sugar transport system ATP-binding protein
MGGKDAMIEVRGLSVADGDRWMVQGLSLSVRPGALHMVLGERGAGKSALLEAVAGARREAKGSVRLGAVGASAGGKPAAEGSGKPTAEGGTACSGRRRLAALIPRELSAGSLRVGERLLLHRPPCVAGVAIHAKRAREEARALAARVGLDALLDVPMEALRPIERRLIELAAAIRQEPAAILLDEPTADLGAHEARQFLATVRAVAEAEQVPILFTTTWPRDAYPEAAAVTILWRGAEPVTVSTAECTESALVQRWTGGIGIRRAPTGPHTPGDTLMRVEGIIMEGRGRETALAGVEFEVRAGEVLAVVGAPADGLNLLHEALLGDRAPRRGSILFLGKEIIRAPRRLRVESGMTFVNPPIARDQSVSEFSVEENLILGQTHVPPYARRGLLRNESIRGNATRTLQDFEIPDATPRTPFRDLSLGARQRVIVAREVIHNPRLLVVRSPAQGLSLEAQEYVRRTLILQCERGSGLLWLTEEPEEAMRVADRLAVLTAGRLVWIPVTETLTREAIIAEMAGTAA